jgi:hypothetical protein
MLPSLYDDPKRWFECAAKMRQLASEITDSDGRATALMVARDLDWFAEWFALRTERRANKLSRRHECKTEKRRLGGFKGRAVHDIFFAVKLLDGDLHII